MSKPQKGRKHRSPNRTPRPIADPSLAGRSTRRALPIRGNQEMVGTLLEQAPPHQLVELLMPHLWAMLADGIRANACVDACLTMKYAFGQFGIRSQLQAVQLSILSGRGDQLYGNSTPTWSGDGTVFNGHCVLALPDSGRFIDPTIEQFKEIAALRQGPLIGLIAEGTGSAGPGEAMVAGSRAALQRGGLIIVYTVAEQENTDAVEVQPWVVATSTQHRRTGVNLASLTLDAVRKPYVVERARQTPYPRLHALIDAIGDAPAEPGQDRDLRFRLPGPDGAERWLRLDEIPLPEATPSAFPF